MRLDVTFTEDRVHFPPDHLRWAGASTDGVLTRAAIRDADPQAAPPEIRTVSGDTLFISATQREELEQFCRINQIPLRHRRPDVWAGLLEPFLDTEFTTERHSATLAHLGQVGLTSSEVARIRNKVAPLVRAYNGLHREWCHLGLADLLDAATSPWVPEHLRVELGRTADLYAWATKIADLSNKV